MKTRMIAYYLYFIACFVTIVSMIADWELVMLIAKPVIMPAIYYYYLSKTKSHSTTFAIIMLLNFIGDSIVILRFDNTLYFMIPYLFAYVLLMKFVIKDSSVIKYELTNVLFAIGVAALLSFILIMLLHIQNEDGFGMIPPMIIYGIILCTLVTLAAYNHFATGKLSAFYMITACACALGSDIFYVIYNLHFNIPVLNYINTSLQLMTYFFLVKYMLSRKSISSLKTSL